MNSRNGKKIALALVVALLAGAFFWFDLHHQLTLESIRGFQEQAGEFYAQRPLLAIAGFAGVYLLVVALNLPGGALLGLLAGAVFGVLVGTVVVSFASTIAATLACALSRYLFRDLVRSRFPQVVARVDRGMAREGSFYLFSLRLIPVVPFFVINMVMGLTAIRLRTFYWVSQLGMLPGTLVFVNAGNELGRLTSTGEIFSPRLVLAFALLGLLPLAAKKLLNYYRARTPEAEKLPTGGVAAAGPGEKELRIQAQSLASGCTACGACAVRCQFLKRSGLPGEIANAFLAGKSLADPFACSLCNLCTTVCPEKLEPGDFFLALRRGIADHSGWDSRPYKRILSYERLGSSPLFSTEYLPPACQTVFFPGCNLPGTRPESTWQLFRRLQEQIPALGLVLNCCHKPSHDLGRWQYFSDQFGALRRRLYDSGVREILLACPNCYKVFLNHGREVRVRSVWEVLAAGVEQQGPGPVGTTVTVHDPCPLRNLPELQRAARTLIAGQNLAIKEMRSAGARTLCCGEGGAVGFIDPELAAAWGTQRREQANGLPVVTYCAGCAGFLGRAGLQTIHLADLLAEPAQALVGKAVVATPPRTYLNRLLLKYRLGRLPKNPSAADSPKP
ncbi:VTT domain-containing protein [Desulfurivibrio sp. D14AmB]|uniref:VTT domain-containing protein n=1 Tax=Desulfurivibrio sp. D14AmB TaxID=3374370 RepID=UPI00376EC080